MATRSSSPVPRGASSLASHWATLVSALAFAPFCAAKEAERPRSSPAAPPGARPPGPPWPSSWRPAGEGVSTEEVGLGVGASAWAWRGGVACGGLSRGLGLGVGLLGLGLGLLLLLLLLADHRCEQLRRLLLLQQKKRSTVLAVFWAPF